MNSYTLDTEQKWFLKSCSCHGGIAELPGQVRAEPLPLNRQQRFVKGIEAQHLGKLGSKEYPLIEVSAQNTKMKCYKIEVYNMRIHNKENYTAVFNCYLIVS